MGISFCSICGETLATHVVEDCMPYQKTIERLQKIKTVIPRPTRGPLDLTCLYTVRKLLTGKRFVELGSGTGDLFLRFAYWSRKARGFEIKPQDIGHCLKNIDNIPGLKEKIHLHGGDYLPCYKQHTSTISLEMLCADAYYIWRYPKKDLEFMIVLNDLIKQHPVHFPNGASVMLNSVSDPAGAYKLTPKAKHGCWKDTHTKAFDQVIHYQIRDLEIDPAKDRDGRYANSTLGELKIVSLPYDGDLKEKLLKKLD